MRRLPDLAQAIVRRAEADGLEPINLAVRVLAVHALEQVPPGEREDRVALRCWCGFGSNNLNANAWARLRSHCEQNGQTPWQVLEQLETGSLNIPYTGVPPVLWTHRKARG